ncbi:MAG: YkgJ family cysteine cluster protein [Cyanobacteriota bacterium]
MDIWEEKLNIKKPTSCNRMAYCCKAATSVKPWIKINNAKINQNLKDFFNIFYPYYSHEDVKNLMPDAYNACMEIAISRPDINIEDIYFYKCRFLRQPNNCMIYEDRPTLCRKYPDSPFDSIPITCGYNKWSIDCKQKHIMMQSQLHTLKFKQFARSSFYLISPVFSWIK